MSFANFHFVYFHSVSESDKMSTKGIPRDFLLKESRTLDDLLKIILARSATFFIYKNYRIDLESAIRIAKFLDCLCLLWCASFVQGQSEITNKLVTSDLIRLVMNHVFV